MKKGAMKKDARKKDAMKKNAGKNRQACSSRCNLMKNKFDNKQFQKFPQQFQPTQWVASQNLFWI